MKVNKFDYSVKKDIFFDVIGELKNNNVVYDDSFSNGLFEYDNNTVQEQINKFEALSEDKGLNIPEFMKEYKDIIYSDFDFISNNGFIDAILYKYDKEKGVLSGYRLVESADEEYYMKYSYEYYKYDMGKNFILQSYDTMEDYYKDTSKLFLVGYFESMYGIDKEEILKYQIVKEYKDGYIVFADLEKIFDVSQEIRYQRFLDDVKRDLKNTVKYCDINNDILIITINVDKFNINDIDFDDIIEDFIVKKASEIYNL